MRSLQQRFWLKVAKLGLDECWNWLGFTGGAGYGYISLGGRGLRKNLGAHVVSLLLSGIGIPAGKCVLHRCDNRKCVNPKHLFIGDRGDNARDCAAKGRTASQTIPGLRSGARNGRAKLSVADVISIQKLCSKGLSQSEAGRLYGVHHATVNQIVHGRRWKDFSCRY